MVAVALTAICCPERLTAVLGLIMLTTDCRGGIFFIEFHTCFSQSLFFSPQRSETQGFTTETMKDDSRIAVLKKSRRYQ